MKTTGVEISMLIGPNSAQTTITCGSATFTEVLDALQRGISELEWQIANRSKCPMSKVQAVSDPVISIARASKTYGLFDSISLIRDFKPYHTEAQAVRSGKIFFLMATDKEPRIVYPKITSMRAS